MRTATILCYVCASSFQALCQPEEFKYNYYFPIEREEDRNKYEADTVAAKDDTTLRIKITNFNDHLLDFALVKVESEDTIGVKSTGENGEVAFGFKPGNYRMMIVCRRFKTFELVFTLPAGQALSYHIKLRLNAPLPQYKLTSKTPLTPRQVEAIRICIEEKGELGDIWDCMKRGEQTLHKVL